MTHGRIMKIVAIALLFIFGLVNNGCIGCLLAILGALASAVSGIGSVLMSGLAGFGLGSMLGGSKGKAVSSSVASADGLSGGDKAEELRQNVAQGKAIDSKAKFVFQPENQDFGNKTELAGGVA